MSKQPKGAWSYYERLPRPSLRWVCLASAAWAGGLCDVFSSPLDSTTRGVIFAFAAAVYGLRGWEKLREQPVAQDPDPWGYFPSYEGGMR